MIQNRQQIIDLCQNGMVKPFNMQMVQSASLDLRIGETIKLCKRGYTRDYQPFAKWQSISIGLTTEENPFLIHPGQILLVESFENIFLPNNIAAQFMLKSSIARQFFQHMLAGWCDPGWCGKLTMEFINAGFEPFPLFVGKPIGQLIFHEILPTDGYNGKYQGIFSVQESLED
jgi:dCTP deaminase